MVEIVVNIFTPCCLGFFLRDQDVATYHTTSIDGHMLRFWRRLHTPSQSIPILINLGIDTRITDIAQRIWVGHIYLAILVKRRRAIEAVPRRLDPALGGH